MGIERDKKRQRKTKVGREILKDTNKYRKIESKDAKKQGK